MRADQVELADTIMENVGGKLLSIGEEGLERIIRAVLDHEREKAPTV